MRATAKAEIWTQVAVKAQFSRATRLQGQTDFGDHVSIGPDHIVE
jgi:hypothetical protein